ncbi:MAG: hypothetical protein HFF26_05235 [Oscillospiraceae bacterium]|nr:hypothetical protein [Oscillospiraceae bacterium]
MGTGFHFEEGRPLFTFQSQDIPVMLALMAAAVALEVFLALKEDRRLGLILPGLGLLWTLARLGLRIVQVAQTTQRLGASWLANPGQALAVAFAVENIPTLLLLAVYGLCRAGRRWRLRRQVDKSRIEDL